MGRDVHGGVCMLRGAAPTPCNTHMLENQNPNIECGNYGAERVKFLSNSSLTPTAENPQIQTVIVFLLTRGTCIFMHACKRAHTHTCWETNSVENEEFLSVGGSAHTLGLG